MIEWMLILYVGNFRVGKIGEQKGHVPILPANYFFLESVLAIHPAPLQLVQISLFANVVPSPYMVVSIDNFLTEKSLTIVVMVTVDGQRYAVIQLMVLLMFLLTRKVW